MELKLGDCRIVVDFGFPALMAVLFLWADGNFLLQGLAVCMLHELGHGLMMWASRAGIREVWFYAAGMQMRTNTAFLTNLSLLCIYLSGPAVNLLFTGILWHSRPETALLHLCMGCFNLLPFRMLDGGAALLCVLEDKPGALRVRQVFCVLLAAVCIACLWIWEVRNPALYLMSAYLCISELLDANACMYR